LSCACMARLHNNFCINKRMKRDLPPFPQGAERTFTVHEGDPRALAAVNIYKKYHSKL
jgi:hypothetical protein